ncbi:MAG: PrsW family glutamic-type intramembrane protease [Chloroflexota bacterium]
MDAAATIASAVLAYLPIVAWLIFFYTRDRSPEPKRAVVVMFLLGVGATVPAAVANTTWQEFLLGSRFLTFELAASPAVSVAAYTAAAAFSEELLKAGVAWLGLRRSLLDEPMDGIIYFTAVSLGFAAAENFDYVLGTFRGTLSGGLGTIGTFQAAGITAGERAVLNTLGHVAWTATIGYLVAQHTLRRLQKRVVVGGLVLVAALHTLFNLSHIAAVRLLRDDPHLVQVAAMLPALLVSLGVLAIVFKRARRDDAVQQEQQKGRRD